MGTQDVRIWKDFPGRLSAVDYAAIRPQVSGRITEILFQDGQHVKKGDVLFVIDSRPYKAAVEQAKAALQAAQSNYNLADKEYKRAQELIKTNAISQRIVDERRSRFNFVLAEISGAKAALQKAEIDLDYARVKAPISGRVSRAEITLGNVVESGPGAPIVTTIVDDESIYVDFEVDEQTYLSNIREQVRSKEDEGKIPVQVILRGDAEQPIDGVIHAFDNRINPASGTIRARAVLENSDGALLSGMFAKVRLGSADRARRMLVGEKAIGIDQDRRFVYVVNKDNVIEYRQVQLGDRSGHSRVVLSGLSEGEKVVAQGIIMIRPGMPVAPMMAGEQDKAESVPAAAPSEEPPQDETSSSSSIKGP
ncbi:MAG: efflux RND transporter periplasmic adaptor subunit [Rhodospirillales bacterium]|nr:efflux RND transporter periplasmic adaptor subunit [Alphaproteobacteria bacterium]USO06726.1 MAG: efflux RND transporter periplasmic adaptor subunit [Rhodospirillales bacterium]